MACLREGDREAAHPATSILKLLVDRLREAWPEVQIVFRGDAGFGCWKLHRRCDRRGVGDVTGLATDAKIKRIAKPRVDAAEAGHKLTKQ